MNTRTKFLLGAMVVVGVFWAGDAGYRNFIEEPGKKRERELAQLDKKVKTVQDAIINTAEAGDQLYTLERISLPYDPELARAHYQDWLLKLTQQVNLTNASVDGANPVSVSLKDRRTRKPKEIYLRYSFSLRGRGSLLQITQFLHAFYQGGHLHKINSLTLNPVAGGRLIDLSVSIEALGLTRCERKGELSTEAVQRLVSGDVADYRVIAQRNLFARHGDSTLASVVLNAITVGKGGRSEAWFATGKGETKVMKPGADFQIGGHHLELVDIVANRVLLDVDGRVIALTTGQSVQTADDLSANDQTATQQ